MATTEDLAVLAVTAYEFVRTDENDMPAPDGWVRLDMPPMGSPDHEDGTFFDTATGFEAVAYQKGDEIVISYAGTYFGNGPGEAFKHYLSTLPFGNGSYGETPADAEINRRPWEDWDDNLALGAGVLSEGEGQVL